MYIHFTKFQFIELNIYVTGCCFGDTLFLYPDGRRNVMGWLIFAGGVIVGGAFGFFIACVIMINNTRVVNRKPKKR